MTPLVDESLTESAESSADSPMNAVREAPGINAAPVFDANITRTVDETVKAGENVPERVEATDPDGDDLTYEVTGGADMGAFKIDNNGQITVGTGTELNYEGSGKTTYVIEVTAADPFGLSGSDDGDHHGCRRERQTGFDARARKR